MAPMIELRLYEQSGRFRIEPASIAGFVEYELYTDVIVRGHPKLIRVYETLDQIDAKIRTLATVPTCAVTEIPLTHRAIATKSKK